MALYFLIALVLWLVSILAIGVITRRYTLDGKLVMIDFMLFSAISCVLCIVWPLSFSLLVIASLIYGVYRLGGGKIDFDAYN